MRIRASVRENRLSDPSRVTVSDYVWHVTHAAVHIWEDNGVIQGWSAGDLRDGSIWALFVDPQFEGRGIGQALISATCRSLAADGHYTAKLTTDSGTRAENFYLLDGWEPQGITERREIIFTKLLRD